MPRRLSLTPALVARVTRAVPDTGPPPGMVLMQDADYDDWVTRTLAGNPAPDRPARLFAYGSLIWKPEIPHTAETEGTARGWHRSFCFRMPRFRGTPDLPGLMMALDRGGACRGLLLTLPTEDLPGQLHRLFRREFTVKPINSAPRWITVATAEGAVPALAFVMNRASPLYVGRLPDEEVAAVLATACGHVGSSAEYLANTVRHLEARGIHDRHLWRLQRLVAAEIEAQAG
ncbi:gamma-glutamylcyclotransferase [Neotabrizicola shimadae]|uniref:glutathione-specific gamma-glutamylcyclotransferase n=1 Tax=Neotabrizicola shimadae TaxID=2807096 RepID=A0A8G0ZWW9_9RHOB|nr:gamma-glutamylcyclotransferase [Neotabrizicola shimadae]QYZ70432.1 gamma-glutamylcyclotransferase [Neotabrizicola shimadae]